MAGFVLEIVDEDEGGFFFCQMVIGMLGLRGRDGMRERIVIGV